MRKNNTTENCHFCKRRIPISKGSWFGKEWMCADCQLDLTSPGGIFFLGEEQVGVEEKIAQIQEAQRKNRQ